MKLTYGILFLLLSISLEILATTSLKQSVLQPYPWRTISAFSYSSCFIIFYFAIKIIPVGIAYCVWSALGSVSICLIDHFIFESFQFTSVKVLSLLLLCIGSVGLIFEDIIIDDDDDDEKSQLLVIKNFEQI